MSKRPSSLPSLLAYRVLLCLNKAHEMSKDEQESLYHHLLPIKNRFTQARLCTNSNGKDWADLHAECALHMYKHIVNFAVHTPYILNEYYDFDESEKRFIVVMPDAN
jgi:metal-dependent HD superfamily phosphatase/phosphodiesterase